MIAYDDGDEEECIWPDDDIIIIDGDDDSDRGGRRKLGGLVSGLEKVMRMKRKLKRKQKSCFIVEKISVNIIRSMHLF